MEYVLTDNVSANYIIKNETYSTYGHCRCCLEEGNHRDITKSYIENGKRELYGDIFLDCFNLFLSTNMNLSTLICTSCVDRLRSANEFKQLVMQTEQQLMAALQDCDTDQVVLVNVPVPEETLDTTIGFKIEVNDDDVKPLNLTDKLCDFEDCQVEELLESQEIVKQPEVSKENSLPPIFLTEKMALLVNTCTLLEFSNATLFKSKMRAGFPCFYCKEIFENFQILRHHQIETHSPSHLKKVLKKYTAESLVVYADVTELRCLICDMYINNFKELKSHLIKVHKKKFYPKYTDRVVPFKLLENNYFQCQICGFDFETFGAIERHMNTHFRNYVCYECGSGFVTVLRLKTHTHAVHRVGNFPCEYCERVFTTQLRYKTHVDFVHKMLKKLKCMKCSERFSDYFVQRKHMVEVHGEVPIVYRCNVCNKAFNRRYTLSCHMKRHLDQKDVHCNLCTYTCYNKTELREHMLRHNKDGREKIFMCTVCNKSYTRKKTLKEHLRIHSDHRKYVCSFCDEKFVQNNSLRVHMRNHHSDDVIK